MGEESPGEAIGALFAGVGDWRGAMLEKMRDLIKKADPEVVEELKWKKPSNPAGVAVWSHAGMICTGEIYKDHVKLTFAKGAALEDPHSLFNASLDGNLRRAIDLHQGEEVDEAAFIELVQAATAFNLSSKHRQRG